MKILVVSDTHGQNHNLEEVLKKSGKLDLLIHLGDMEGSEEDSEESEDAENIEETEETTEE